MTPDAGYMADIGPRLYQDFLARGLLIRPLGNTIYLMPPYCSTESELDPVYDAIGEIVACVDRRPFGSIPADLWAWPHQCAAECCQAQDHDHACTEIDCQPKAG